MSLSSNIGAYYTGNFKAGNNNDDNNIVFCGGVNNLIKLWEANPLVQCLWDTGPSSSSSAAAAEEEEDGVSCDKAFLYMGGALLRLNPNITESDINGDIYRDKRSTASRTSQAKQAVLKRLLKDYTLSLNVISLTLWDMFMIDNDNYKNSQHFEQHCYNIVDSFKPTKGEIALYDKATDEEIGKEWREVRLGRLYAVSIDEIREKGSIRHKLIVNVDTRGLASIVSHIWERNNTAIETSTMTTINIDGSPSTITNNENIVDNDINLRVMTYNIWHNNPPSYLYVDNTSRWKRYSKRLKHLASIIEQYNPDIILLQEVRLDSAFRNANVHDDDGYKYYDAGSQLDHMLGLLKNNEYNAVFQPMMSFITKEKLSRNEEGVAILSKYDIVDIDTLLLPRHFDDSNDNHQRGVLCAKIRIDNTTFIDVMTTHLSLSHESRMQSVQAIKQYSGIRESKHNANRNSNYDDLYFQVLAGDFNAEPNEESVQLLTKEELIDTWLYKNSNNDNDQGFTFPTDNPIKRIDFILLKNITSQNHISVVDSRLVGGDPTPDSMQFINQNLGMLDRYSPIYGSDHLALFTDFNIKK